MSQKNIDFIIRVKDQLDGLNRTLSGVGKLRDEMDKTSSISAKLSNSLKGMATGAMMGVGMGLVRMAQRIPTMMVAGVKMGVQWNATLEEVSVAFETLLGSAEAAQKRVEEIVEFTTRTPFQQAEVLQVNRLLQALTNGALATAEGMRLVGDASAATGPACRETSMWVGRLYAGLQDGVPVGRATLRLVEMGLITGKQAQQLNEMAKEAQGASGAWRILEDTFSASTGAMQDDLSAQRERITLARSAVESDGSRTRMDKHPEIMASYQAELLAIEGVIAVLREAMTLTDDDAARAAN